MADFNVLKATIAARIPDNTDQLIDAADVRDSFLDSLDEVNGKKQDTLVSGTNIKTVNGQDILGSGDLALTATTSWGSIQGDIADQTDLQTALSGKQDVISNLATIESGAAAGATAVQPGDLAAVATSGQYSDLTGTPSLATVATSGDYDDLLNKPSIPAAQVNSDWNAVSGVAQILNKPTIPAAQVQSDWNEADSTAVDYIKNKPSIPARNLWYGTCPTAAGSTPKVVTTSSGDFMLATGNVLAVLFSHTNSVSSASLQVDGQTAKSAYPLDGTSNISNRWGSGELVIFVYDGTKFILNDQATASTTAYGITKLNSATNSTSTSEAATASAVKAAYDHGGVQSVNGSTGAVTLSIPSAPGTLDTTATTAQATSSSEALSGAVTLHKVSKTGTYSDLIGTPSLATVATSGSYNDLTDQPTIPAAQVNSDWNAVSGVAQILNKPTIPSAPGTLNTDNSTAQTVSSSEALTGAVKLHKVSKTGTYSDLIGTPSLATVATSGLYSDLSGTPTIPAAPGTLDTTATTAQATNASEALSGSVTLHKVAKTGTYTDLIGTPTIPTVPAISTDVAADKADNSKTTGAKAVYDFVKPATQSSQPAGGMAPGILYNLGTLTGSVTIAFASPSDASVANEYGFTFDTSTTAPTITWPNSVTGWAGNCLDNGAPLIAASKHYEVSVLGGYGLIAEFE